MDNPEPKISEEEFDKRVEERFKDELVFLGTDKNNKELFLRFDFASVAFNPIKEEWVVAGVWFHVIDKDEEDPKFTWWKQPEILLYQRNTFSKKMEKFMRKKYKLAEFDNEKVSSEIVKIAESVDG